MDDVDIANEQADLYLAGRLYAQRKRAQALLQHEGSCLNCDADLYDNRRPFCDPDCAKDWQKRNEVSRKQNWND